MADTPTGGSGCNPFIFLAHVAVFNGYLLYCISNKSQKCVNISGRRLVQFLKKSTKTAFQFTKQCKCMQLKAFCNRTVVKDRLFNQTLLVMKLTFILCTVAVLQVAAHAAAQTVTFSGKDVSLEKIFSAVKEQTGYGVFYDNALLKDSKPVTIAARDLPLQAFLNQVLLEQKLDFSIKRKTIFIRRKQLAALEPVESAIKDTTIAVSGRVIAADSRGPLPGATVKAKNTHIGTTTDADGNFFLELHSAATSIVVTFLGYEQKEIAAASNQGGHFIIALQPLSTALNTIDVVSTGFQSIPKERATGSFATVGNRLFNQQVTTNILERLPAIANGVTVDKGTLAGNEQIMIRGLSTIKGPKAPLIVVDNFPYEGDINNINPNIVENITLLKDAAAASIWGARAANGVVVITTKKGQFGQALGVDFTANVTVAGKPDLGYIRQMSAADFIDMEQGRFTRGFYDADLKSTSYPVISPVVALLDKERNGLVTGEEVTRELNRLKSIDVRDQYRRYMYTPMVNQQYFLNLYGGTDNYSWISSIGYDNNTGNLAEKYQRLNFRFENTYRPVKKLSVTTGIYYTQSATRSGRSGYGTISMKGNSTVPYMELADENGNPAVLPYNINQAYKDTAGNGRLQDWNYYPLTDWEHNISKNNSSDILATAAVGYTIINGLLANLRYQYQRQMISSEGLFDEQSIYARDFANRYAQYQPDGSIKFNVPKGAVLDRFHSLLQASNFRGQLSYSRKWAKHSVDGIAGFEARSSNNRYDQNRFYGFNTNNLSFASIDYATPVPTFIGGGAGYIQNGQFISDRTTRFASLFANAAYTYNNKYTISASVRKDASNLFGLNTNDQWNPFYSTGFAWDISREKFYAVDALPYLRLRATYGFNGNINPAMVAVSTIKYSSIKSEFTGTSTATFNNYYNPELKWETIGMFNLGLDFASRNQRISGAIEYFSKKGIRMFGVAPIDYTTGIPTSTVMNVANMTGKGMDIELKTLNIDRAFKWSTILNLSLYRDKVTKYYLSSTSGYTFIGTPGQAVPIAGLEGRPVYSIFAYKWAGLDPETGDPQGYIDNKPSKDYVNLTSGNKKIEDLQFFGSAIPTTYGSFINSFSYKRFSLNLSLMYKFGYWFRRTSIDYSSLFSNWRGHSDYSKRWQQPGDELYTNVPSNLYKANSSRDAFYNGSSALVEKGDHIRLQYINLDYEFGRDQWKGLPFQHLHLYFNVNNIGVVWKANKSSIDPDYNLGGNTLVPRASYTFGFKAKI